MVPSDLSGSPRSEVSKVRWFTEGVSIAWYIIFECTVCQTRSETVHSNLFSRGFSICWSSFAKRSLKTPKNMIIIYWICNILIPRNFEDYLFFAHCFVHLVHHLLFFLLKPWAQVLAMPYWQGPTRPKQLPMAANILSSIFWFFGSYRVNSLYHCCLSALPVAISITFPFTLVVIRLSRCYL